MFRVRATAHRRHGLARRARWRLGLRRWAPTPRVGPNDSLLLLLRIQGREEIVPNVNTKLALAGFVLLSAGAVLGPARSSFAETVILTISAAGILWLFWKLRREESSSRYGIFCLGVLPLLFVCLRSKFVSTLPMWAMVVTGPVASALMIGAVVNVPTRIHAFLRWNFIPGVSIGLIALAIFWLSISLNKNSINVGILSMRTFELVIIFFTVTVLAAEKKICRSMSRVGILSLAACLLFAWVDFGRAIHRIQRGVELFHTGRLEEATRLVSKLRDEQGYLDFEPVSYAGWLRRIGDQLENSGTAHQWQTLADMSLNLGQYDKAAESYRKAHVLDPENFRLRLNYAQCLFELGYRTQALEEFEAIQTEYAKSESTHILVAIARTRMGDLTRARELFELACAAGWKMCDEAALEAEGNSIGHYFMSEVQPLGADAELTGGITLYDVARFLEAAGVPVFHPPVPVGIAGVTSPVDLHLLSSTGAPSKRDFLRVSDRDVSNHGRGYNLAAIDPRTGVVADVGSFDTWLRIDANKKLADFVSGIPEGYIVAGTINDAGAASLRAEGRNALKELGVTRFPDRWWAHAFIGVKGAPPGSAIESLGDRAAVALGVLASSILQGTPEAEIERVVIAAALKAPTGIAVYLESLDEDDRIVIARVRPPANG